MAIDKSVLGGRVKKFRQRLKLKQADLASQMGFSSSETISQIEKGKRDVKAWELSEFARILSVSIDELLRREVPERPPAVLWRQSPEGQREAREAMFIKRCKQYSLLEELSGMKVSRSFPQKSVDPELLDFEIADQLAMSLRNEFGLGGHPAEELEKILQDVYGVKIWYIEMEEGSAASTIGPFGPAILMNSNEAPWRRNYNFAHELFHLITWDSIPPARAKADLNFWENLEKIANAFASSLLLPADSLNHEFNRRLKGRKISYTDLIGVARSFGVSTEALLYRLLNMKRISRPTLEKTLEDSLFREFDRTTMAQSWWQPPAIPERFVVLSFMAFQKGNLSRSKLSEILETSLIDLSGFLREYGLSDQEGYDAEVRVA